MFESLIEARPSLRQKEWFAKPMYAFVHFGMNTFTGREWGDGSESESLFDPSDFDPDQWARVFKDVGMRGLILTCKHHDGFCLWPTATTEHSVKNSPYKDGNGDIVKEVMEACRRYDLEFGFYLSPWDRNAACYGSEAYNDFYCEQLTELLTNYGDIFMVWFDGACGEGPNGLVQEYDFPRYVELVRKYQKNAVIFSDLGPDIHWIGNEAGKSRYSEWSVVPGELACLHDEVRNTELGIKAMDNHNAKKHLEAANDDSAEFSFYHLNDADTDLGLAEMILHSKKPVFCPSETDFSMKPGWFYHEEEEAHSVDHLLKVYLHSVGNNSALNLNIPPNKEGKLAEKDVKRLYEFKERLDQEFSKLAVSGKDYREESYSVGVGKYQWIRDLEFNEKKKIGYIVLEEDLDYGQKAASFTIQTRTGNGEYFPIYNGTTIGNKKIIDLNGQEIDNLRIFVKMSRGEVKIKSCLVYLK